MQRLARLCIGDIPAERNGDYSSAQRSIALSIESTAEDLINLLREANEGQVLRFAPLLCRKLLEESLSGVLGRCDPMRLVAAYRGPRSQDFKFGDRNESSINWSRDILCDFSPGNDSWSQATLKKGLNRSLLDGHLCDYLFTTAHELILDQLSLCVTEKGSAPAWTLEIQKHAEGKHFASEIRNKSKQAYSYLSKGIHFEFLPSMSLEPVELKQQIRNSLFVISAAALYSNFCDTALDSIPMPEAGEIFFEISEFFECII